MNYRCMENGIIMSAYEKFVLIFSILETVFRRLRIEIVSSY